MRARLGGRCGARLRGAALLPALVLQTVAAATAGAAGFGLSEQGAKAAGMAGACVAQADDASALYYNVAGLALLSDRQRGKKITLGASATQREESLYQGLAPGIGAGTTAAQDQPTVLAGHGYYLQPFGDRVVAGLGVFSPFAWETDWVPEGWAGRFVGVSSSLTTYDVNPAVAFRLGRGLALGVGATWRVSEVQAGRRLSLADPVTGAPVDVASLAIDTDAESAIGWNAGLLARRGRLSWGLAYRSGMAIDYLGVGRATQIATGDEQLDALVAATLPLDLDLATSTALDFPAVAATGIAWRAGRHFVAEVDAQWTGWSDVEGLAFGFPGQPTFDAAYPLAFEDAVAYRVGLQVEIPNGMQFRLGAGIDESPQPDATVGPLLVDADRLVLAAGWGWDWLDVAFQWHDFDQRIVADQVDGLNGNYRNRGLQLVLTVAR
jgi:long-chain fatty acid transport protein